MDKKYELDKEYYKCIDGHTLYRVRSLKDFGDIRANCVGGYVESEENLSQEGNCWVYNEAMIWGNARVCYNAKIWANAAIYGDAKIYGNVEIMDNAKIYGNAEICGNIIIACPALIKSCDDLIVFSIGTPPSAEHLIAYKTTDDVVCCTTDGYNIGTLSELNKRVNTQNNILTWKCKAIVKILKENFKNTFEADLVFMLTGEKPPVDLYTDITNLIFRLKSMDINSNAFVDSCNSRMKSSLKDLSKQIVSSELIADENKVHDIFNEFNKNYNDLEQEVHNRTIRIQTRSMIIGMLEGVLKKHSKKEDK